MVERSEFVNNSAKVEGAGITGYHVLYRGVLDGCAFWGNRDGRIGGGRSVWLYAYAARIEVRGCMFEGEVGEEIAVQFPESEIVDGGSNRFNVGELGRVGTNK
jgi:hypothetical protein